MEMKRPKLHQVISVAKDAEDGVYVARVDLTDIEGMRYEADYVSRPGDNFGLAPAIREAIGNWVESGGAVTDYVPPPAPRRKKE